MSSISTEPLLHCVNFDFRPGSLLARGEGRGSSASTGVSTTPSASRSFHQLEHRQPNTKHVNARRTHKNMHANMPIHTRLKACACGTTRAHSLTSRSSGTARAIEDAPHDEDAHVAPCNHRCADEWPRAGIVGADLPPPPFWLLRPRPFAVVVGTSFPLDAAARFVSNLPLASRSNLAFRRARPSIVANWADLT